MMPTVNRTDVYVPSIICLPSVDDAADVVTPPVSAAALAAPGEVSCPLMPGDVPVVLLASGLGVAVELVLLLVVLDVFTALVAKPGHLLALNPMFSFVTNGLRE